MTNSAIEAPRFGLYQKLPDTALPVPFHESRLDKPDVRIQCDFAAVQQGLRIITGQRPNETDLKSAWRNGAHLRDELIEMFGLDRQRWELSYGLEDECLVFKGSSDRESKEPIDLKDATSVIIVERSANWIDDILEQGKYHISGIAADDHGGKHIVTASYGPWLETYNAGETRSLGFSVNKASYESIGEDVSGIPWQHLLPPFPDDPKRMEKVVPVVTEGMKQIVPTHDSLIVGRSERELFGDDFGEGRTLFPGDKWSYSRDLAAINDLGIFFQGGWSGHMIHQFSKIPGVSEWTMNFPATGFLKA